MTTDAKPTEGYPGQKFFHDNNASIKRAEDNAAPTTPADVPGLGEAIEKALPCDDDCEKLAIKGEHLGTCAAYWRDSVGEAILLTVQREIAAAEEATAQRMLNALENQPNPTFSDIARWLRKNAKFLGRGSLKAYDAALRERVLAPFRDLAIEMEKHSDDHIHDTEVDNYLPAAVEGVCADRINAVLKGPQP